MDNRYRTTTLRLPLPAIWCLGVIVALLAATPAAAQNFARIGNQFVTASICSDKAPGNLGGGRFYISAGPANGSHNLLYATTSNVVFRIVSNGTPSLYSSTGSGGSGGRPLVEGTPVGNATPVTYIQYSSFYVAPTGDSCVTTWKVQGYTILQRLFVEKPQTVYDNGTDVVIEYEWTVDPFGPPSELGIFMMLDLFNGQAAGTGGNADYTSVVTSQGYFPVEQGGKLFTPPFDTIPDWYHAGNFLFQAPVNNVMPIHRLKGTTHGGLPVNTPDIFAIGDWINYLRYYSWDISSGDVGRPFHDCASAMRWGHLTGSGKIRTAYGMDDRTGNNLYHCRDTAVFIDIKTERLVEQKVKNGVYSPTTFNVDMWISNTNPTGLTDMTVTMTQPIGGAAGRNRLTLNPATPNPVGYVSLPARSTKHLHWVIDVAPGTNDSLLDIPLEFKYQYNASRQPRVFKVPCSPIVTIKGYRDPVPPPQDVMAPVNTVPVPNKTTWSTDVLDRHPGYAYDTGLDKILITANDNNNFLVTQTPQVFTRCDTTMTVNFLFKVVDTTQAARVVFCAYDCKGNSHCDSVIYKPRPDTFKPEIVSIDSLGSAGPPCNTRVFGVHVIDSTHQLQDAGDNGFGIIEIVGTPVNFDTMSINYDKGYAGIVAFDPRASFRVQVLDSMKNGSITVRFADYAGNADTITFNYCTLPDILPPVSTKVAVANPIPGQPTIRWDVHTTDERSWDRGLDSIAVLAQTNMNFTYPPLVGGDSAADFMVTVPDVTIAGFLKLEVRDTYYPSIPGGHADTIVFDYSPIPDTMAPLIAFLPDAATNGASAMVQVDDIHILPGGLTYQYDRGLDVVKVASKSPNIEIDPAMPISFTPGDKTTTFRIRILDTLAMDPLDSICIEATDLYGNKSVNCYHYPIQPDTSSPILLGTLDPLRTSLSATVTDSRSYDRGLGSIALENPVNIAGQTSWTGLNGSHLQQVDFTIPDPTKSISGTFVVYDLVGLADQSVNGQMIHALRIPFELPAVDLKLVLPAQVEQTADLNAALIVSGDYNPALVSNVKFDVTFAGLASYKSTRDVNALLTTTPAAGVLHISIAAKPGIARIRAGDTLGVITFAPKVNSQIDSLLIGIDKNSMVINSNQGSSITVQKSNDPLSSRVVLPPPFLRLAADSITYVNGICERILTSLKDRRAKLNGLAILAVSPQPAAITGGNVLQADVRDIPADGATADLLAADGTVVASVRVYGGTDRVTRVMIPLPASIPAGAYFLQMSSPADRTWAKVLVVQ
ncbi:MAG: hypothetical protein JWQ98_984 [Chlorobi bacterium]|nr:hypothetical protein [Chlorobiota bacterium]